MYWNWTLLVCACLALDGAGPAAAQEPRRPEQKKQFDAARRFERLDKNHDGYLDRSEVPQRLKERFEQIDADGDGKLSKEELQNAPKLLENLDRMNNGGRTAEIITPAAKGERIADKLKAGDPAPDFTLPLVSGQGEVTLSSFQGEKPVVLIFASYT